MQLCYSLFLASMRLPSPSETAAAANGSPLEPPTFTDGEIAGQRAGKRPRPTERPHSGLYPGREAAHTFTGKILTDGDCYTPSDKALTIRKR